MPGVIFISWLALKMFGYRVMALRCLDFLFQLLNLGLIFYLASLLAKDRKAIWAGVIASGLYAIFYLGLGHTHTAQRDGFALPFLLAASVFYLNWKDRKNWAGIVLAGLMTGMAVLMKPTLGLAGVGISVLYLRRAWKLQSSWPKLALEQGLLLGSALLPLVLTGIIYKLSGASFELLKDCWIFLTKVYASRNMAGAKQGLFKFYLWSLGYLVYTVLRKETIIWLGVFLYFIKSAGLDECRSEKSESRLILSAMLVACGLSYLVQDGSLYYQQIPLAGFAAIFAGAFFSAAGNGIAAGIRSRVPWLRDCAGAIIIGGVALTCIDAQQLRFIGQYCFRDLHSAYLAQEPWYHKTAEYIASRTAPDQYVGSLGDCEMLFLAQRLAPTRHTFWTAIVITDASGKLHPVELKWQDELCSDLSKNPPPYFLWVDSMYLISCLKDFVVRNYSLETQITDIDGLDGERKTVNIYIRHPRPYPSPGTEHLK
jgi:hypothetical protein